MAEIKEADVHKHLYTVGLEAVIDDAEARLSAAAPEFGRELTEYDQPEFVLWKLLKRKALEKIAYLHNLSRYGAFIGTGVKLPIDSTKPMFLDLLGTHEDGLFVLELKVDRGSERNAFSELYAYSNYIAGMFPGSGRKDILNILVAPMLNKITKQAYLYDLMISDRNTVLYQTLFPDETATSLRLSLYIPADEDFLQFANRLLSHDAMSCAVLSFPDIEGWIDSEAPGSGEPPPEYTRKNLERVSSYAAQLMEREGLHGFAYIRKRWTEIQNALGERGSALIISAINPFQLAEDDRLWLVTDQLAEEDRATFVESPALGFEGRLSRIAKQTISDSLGPLDVWLDLPYWGGFVKQLTEVVSTHHMGFRPTGLFRDAYVEHLSSIRSYNAAFPASAIDVERLKIADIVNWFRAWEFMEACGFIESEDFEERILNF